MLKKLINGAIVMMVAAVLVLGGLRTHADATQAYAADVTNYASTGLGIPDHEFDTGSGASLTTPTGWTGSSLTSSTATLKSGVIDLTPNNFQSNKNRDGYDLDYYYQADARPALSTSGRDNNSTNAKVLMINSKHTAVAYAYKTSALTVAPGSYYKISVEVFTPTASQLNIVSGQHNGAFVKVTGDIELSSGGILTNDSWQTHTFYIKGHPFKTISVNLSLGLGDVDSDGNTKLSQGFALFDTAISRSLTELEYNQDTAAASNAANTYIMNAAHEFDGIKDITSVTVINADFDDTTNWSKAPNGSGNSQQTIVSDKGLDNTPALSLSSVGSTASARTGFRSAAFTVERNKYYSINIWQNASDIISGSSSSILSVYDPTEEVDADQPEKHWTDFSLSSYTAPLGDDSWLGDWKTGSFYIKGSSLQDYSAVLELWLGSKTDSARGTVYYDHVRVFEISPEEYSASSSGGTTVDLVSSKSETPADASALNGRFNQMTYEGLLTADTLPTPDSWTALNTAKTGYHDENTTSGVIPASKLPSTMGNYETDKANLLMIKNNVPTAYGYSSQSVTVTASTYKKLSVRLNATSDAKIYLFLKSNNSIIARFDKPVTGRTFATNEFNFFVKGGSADQTLTLEIWLGTDEGAGYNNHSTGTLYVDRVSAVDSDEAAYTAATAISRNTRYDFSSHLTPAADTRGLSEALGWTTTNSVPAVTSVVSGIINLKSYNTSLIGVDLSGLTSAHIDSLTAPYGLLISSGLKTAYGYKLNYAFNYASDTYYRVTVRLITFGINGEGAAVKLGNNTIKSINTETFVSETQDNTRYGNDFVDYIFYVKSGTENTATNNLEIWLGTAGSLKTRTSGIVIVSSILFETSTEAEYTDNLTLLDNDTDGEITNKSAFALGADDNTTDPVTPDDDKDKDDFQWWLLPSILFSVFLVLALAAIVIKQVIPARKKHSKTKAITYDRNKTLRGIAHSPVSAAKQKDNEGTEDEESGEQADGQGERGDAHSDPSEEPTPAVQEKDPNTIVLPGAKKAIKIVVRKKSDSQVSDETKQDRNDYFED